MGGPVVGFNKILHMNRFSDPLLWQGGPIFKKNCSPVPRLLTAWGAGRCRYGGCSRGPARAGAPVQEDLVRGLSSGDLRTGLS